MPFAIIVIYILGVGFLADGKQRISSLMNFYNGKEGYTFPKTKDLWVEYEKNINGVMEIVKFNLKGCGFKDLPIELQNKFYDATVNETTYHDLTDEEIVELFKRINSGMPLNSSEGFRTILFKYNKEALSLLDYICNKYENVFFKKFISEKSIKAGEDLIVLLRVLCLMKAEEDSTGIEKQSIIRTIKKINSNDVKKLESMINSIINGKTKINNPEIGTAKSLPYIMVEMKYASKVNKYFEAINIFYSDEYKSERANLYNQFRNSTTSIKCVNHRRGIFRNIAKWSNIGMYYKDEWDAKKMKEGVIKNINVNVTTIA